MLRFPELTKFFKNNIVRMKPGLSLVETYSMLRSRLTEWFQKTLQSTSTQVQAQGFRTVDNNRLENSYREHCQLIFQIFRAICFKRINQKFMKINLKSLN